MSWIIVWLIEGYNPLKSYLCFSYAYMFPSGIGLPPFVLDSVVSNQLLMILGNHLQTLIDSDLVLSTYS